ncbi:MULTISPECIES: hypothetical protein [Streptomyces]
MLENLPRAGTVMAAGEYLQRFTTCERYSIDPSDERYHPMDEKFDATWGVQFRGTCDDGGHGWIRVFKTSDGLLILNCNPNFRPQGDAVALPASVDGCVLTDEFVRN